MLLASTFFESLLNADFVNALRCPLGTVGVLSVLLGFTGLAFFAKESAKIKLLVYLVLAVGVTMLTIELSKPSGGLTDSSGYSNQQTESSKLGGSGLTDPHSYGADNESPPSSSDSPKQN